MKIKSSIKLLCKYCFFSNIKGKIYVKCKINGKHKQRKI